MCSPLGHRKQRRQVVVPDSLLQMRRGDKALDSNSGSPSRTLRPPGSAPGSALDRAPTGTCAGALPSAGGVLLSTRVVVVLGRVSVRGRVLRAVSYTHLRAHETDSYL